MKKLLFIFQMVIIVSISNARAQDCDYLTNTKDEFTGANKLETWGKLVREFSGNNANLIFRKIDKSYYLLLNYNIQAAKSIVVGVNDRLMLKLDNDSIIFFNPTEIVSGVLSTNNGITTTQIKVNYSANTEQIQALSKFSIKKVRFYHTEAYYEHDIKEKHVLEIIKAATCILQ